MIFGNHNIATLMQPIVYFVARTDDYKFYGITVFTMTEKLQPAIHAQVSVRLNSSVISYLNGDGNIRVNVLVVKRFSPFDQKIAARKARNISVLFEIVVEQFVENGVVEIFSSGNPKRRRPHIV